MYVGWDKSFTMVQWDQRGAGRTFTKNGPSIDPTMTVERVAEDGIEVAEFLTRHLNQKKIIILGGSWGSILGVYMAHVRPDLFYAYVGSAQMVNWQEDLSAGYARVLAMARADRQSAGSHGADGNWPSPVAFSCQVACVSEMGKKLPSEAVTTPPNPATISPEYASPEDKAQYAEADDFSFMHFWGETLSGPLTKVDLPALGTTFAIPFFIIQGQEDLTAAPELAKAYFDSIKAAEKQFYLVPGTGHEDSATSLALTLKVLIEQVRPLTLASPVGSSSN
jgi:pimeloyl-ACP methyl ester carboxylesterase